MKLALDAWQELPEGTIHTIPVRVDECEVPEAFRRYHWVNLFAPNGFDHIVRAIPGVALWGICSMVPGTPNRCGSR